MAGLESIFGLHGKTALVTGGASGIGFAVVGCLVNAGANVIAMGSRPANQAASALAEFGDKVAYYQFDITRDDLSGETADAIIAQHGLVDILVNNAGAHCKKSLDDMTVADFRRVLEVNLVGAYALTRAMAPHLRKRGGGSVVFMASMASYIGLSNVAGYCSAKSALLGLVRNLAVDLAPDRIRVNAIAPGWIETPMFRGAVQSDPKRLEKILGRIPLHQPGQPDDIGNAVVYLASNAARYVNGVCLPVDGGALISL